MQRFEAPLALVEVVGEVSRDVGRLAVGFDDDAVLVVAELRRGQPRRAVALVHVAERAQSGHRPVDGPRVVQVVLVEVDIEVDAELVQARLDLVEHEAHAE